MSLFTATVINVMQTAVDGTKCKNIEGKEVSVNFRITIIDYSSRAMRIKYRKESFQITFFFVCRAKQKHNDVTKINSDEPRNINKRGVDLFLECSVFIMSILIVNCCI